MKKKYNLLSLVIAILIFIISSLLTISFLLKWNLREKNIKNYIYENDFSFVFLRTDGNESDLLLDIKNILSTIGIPQITLNAVINSEPTKQFIGNFMRQILLYMIYEQDTPVLTKEILLDLAQKNFPIMDEILKQNGAHLTDHQKYTIINLIKNHDEDIISLFPTINNFIRKYADHSIKIYKNISLNEIANFLRTLTSKTLIITFLILLFLCLLLLFFLNSFLKYLKFAVFLYSFFFIFIEIIFGTVLKTFLMNEWHSANVFWNYYINEISKSLWIFLLLSFLLLLFIHFIAQKKKNN